MKDINAKCVINKNYLLRKVDFLFNEKFNENEKF